jgi:hypothetical protein
MTKTLTLRICENPTAGENLEKIKEIFGIKTNTEAIYRAIAYYANYENHAEKNREFVKITNDLQRELNHLKSNVQIYFSVQERLKNV